MTTLRRSNRVANITYDSNGRDYLASVVGCSLQRLSEWLISPKIHSHLQLWYRLSVQNRRRFNDAIDWINTGAGGYFYNPRDLEEDLLLMCLGEGSGSIIGEAGAGEYANYDVKTSRWITQEVWARSAWRIAQATFGPDGGLGGLFSNHPAAQYAFVVDLLCIAFHSIAFRRSESVWERIINSAGDSYPPNSSPIMPEANSGPMSKGFQTIPEFHGESESEFGIASNASLSFSVAPQDVNSDDTQSWSPQTPSPRSPRRLQSYSSKMMQIGEVQISGKDMTLQRSEDMELSSQDEADEPAMVEEWMQNLSSPTSMAANRPSATSADRGETAPEPLSLIDEDGVPINGYRKAPAT